MEAIASSSLINDLVEEIFLRLPVKSLVRLKSLSKQWRSTIESDSFVDRHLKISLKATDMDQPKLMAVCAENFLMENGRCSNIDICFRTLCLEQSPLLSFGFPNYPQDFFPIRVSKSCDGLFCIYSTTSLFIYIVNPATRWVRRLPPARIQNSILRRVVWAPTRISFMKSVPYLVFVKATGYKLVWLYNSDIYNYDASFPKEGLTKCEVFDFRANTWRYLTCTPGYLICNDERPEYVNGSIYWLTEPHDGEIKVVALDIHTEIFRLLTNINPVILTSNPSDINTFTLDNRLCMMTKVHNTKLNEIWRLNSSKDMWEKIYTIDLFSSSSSGSLLQNHVDWKPVAICNNKKILFSCLYSTNVVEYDPQTKSVSSFFKHPDQCQVLRHFPYVQSLISNI